ncbi:hypothetical protein LIER_20750 [Lithospermum erythrorhizon]|uniref:Uncharacterized protein n=1 Tax=Lithospermum erythrorhizon TaxID=34254 RepID=A0AAV3QQG0_LITER
MTLKPKSAPPSPKKKESLNEEKSVEAEDEMLGNAVHEKVSPLMCKEEVMLTAVYASCNIPTRRQLWDGLLEISFTTMPWVEDFNDWLLSCRPEDTAYNGSSFSWTNGRVSKRLDKVLFNQLYGELYPNVRVKLLAKTLSDHAPMLVNSWRPKNSTKGSFKFQKIWFHQACRRKLGSTCIWGSSLHTWDEAKEIEGLSQGVETNIHLEVYLL